MSANKTIAIVAGGEQSEVIVSIKSAKGIFSFLKDSGYNLYIAVIEKDNWHVLLEDDSTLPIDKNDFSFVLNWQKITFDCAYITIHGIPGEDGRLQGYFEMIGMPYTSCNVLASAITYNKYVCNTYLKGFGVNVAPSIRLRRNDVITAAQVVEKVGLPCFVKPNLGGSSFGVTKVKAVEEVEPAIAKAFAEAQEVIIESFMQGTEITNGIFSTAKRLVVLPITEVVPANEFFDFAAKYKGESQEITPARLSAELTAEVQKTTAFIYNTLGCKGIVRIDYIITEGNKINLLEVNTTPGMTPTSFIPQQIPHAGLEIGEVISEIIEDAIARKKA
jgi:D-alanine--D-alanine ligase